eukprot:CAMPEP_0183378194 /NCGR_PEP_ID=MMETSP0164_2-20130417/124787_1 /TAXON_ID=221442 /ORGANISM="Coccolithus pelagicus ssp braarudi, Strain PLY182g" /LENGTH=230 /DNA_ID=CAMNT_0025555741 /DNA_START=409 /DNA_END=1098 /DNA_ORIENTATION=-
MPFASQRTCRPWHFSGGGSAGGSEGGAGGGGDDSSGKGQSQPVESQTVFSASLRAGQVAFGQPKPHNHVAVLHSLYSIMPFASQRTCRPWHFSGGGSAGGSEGGAGGGGDDSSGKGQSQPVESQTVFSASLRAGQVAFGQPKPHNHVAVLHSLYSIEPLASQRTCRPWHFSGGGADGGEGVAGGGGDRSSGTGQSQPVESHTVLFGSLRAGEVALGQPKPHNHAAVLHSL